MAKVFLDANKLIDLVEGRGNKELSSSLDGHQLCVSPLSVHILFYLAKKEVPDLALNGTMSQFGMVDLSSSVFGKSLTGPTNDLEDNIQLHSAAEAEADLFLTNDKRLLKMKFFGKVEIKEGF